MRLRPLSAAALGALTAVAGLQAATAGKAPTSGTVRDGSVTFTPATVVDPILFGGEPGLKLDPTKDGRSFVDWPVSSRQNIGVLYRSTDGGLTYTKRYQDPADLVATGGPACIGRQVPFCAAGGGGDTEVNINPTNGILYMGSQEVLVNQAVGTSFDHGDTFPLLSTDALVGKTATGVDRQWLASRKGTKDVYLAYHVPIVGEYINHSSNAGATGSWDTPPVPQIPNVTQSGSFVLDNSGGVHDGAMYVGYLSSGFKVGVSTDGAKTFAVHAVPGSGHARNFTVLQIDSKGNLYATWVDDNTQKTMLSTSKADAGANRKSPGSQWSEPVVVSSSALNVTIFSNLAAGDPGRIGIGYYGTSAKAKTPDDVQKGKGGWTPYVATSFNALCQWDKHPCAAPLFHESPIAHHLNQDDNICTAGTACLATGGNRNLLDYFSLSLDKQGHLAAVWTDTTNGIGMGFVKVARQATGPSLYAGKPAASLRPRLNGAADPVGDARYPIYGAALRTAPGYPALDLKGTTVALKDARTLRVTVKVGSTAALGSRFPTATVDGATLLQQAKFLVRWDYRGQVYYAGVNVPKGTEANASTPTFFSGAVTSATGVLAAGGGTTYYGVSYSPQTAATGRVTKDGFVIDVPLSAVGSPRNGARFDSVGSYAMLGPDDRTVVLNTLPVVVDSTPTFDTVLR